jgi:hypothetical protein
MKGRRPCSIDGKIEEDQKKEILDYAKEKRENTGIVFNFKYDKNQGKRDPPKYKAGGKRGAISMEPHYLDYQNYEQTSFCMESNLDNIGPENISITKMP